MLIHTVFDVLAAATSFLAMTLVWRWRLSDRPAALTSPGYPVALVIGAVIGAYAFGTANLWLMGAPAIGRSILGALAGAILAIELYKARRGIRGSTGLMFVPGFAAAIAIGRIGCFLSGLQDNTWGIPTTLPWGHDFGDGLARHPVQLYEAATMAAFLAIALVLMARRQPFFMAHGFHVMVAVYAGQRFLWEFLKPYPKLLGPLNLFQLLCLALLAYAFVMMVPRREPDPA